MFLLHLCASKSLSNWKECSRWPEWAFSGLSPFILSCIFCVYQRGVSEWPPRDPCEVSEVRDRVASAFFQSSGTKQTANPLSPLWLTRISEMSTSSVSWSTDRRVSTSPLKVGHIISPFWIHAQILCPFSSPQLWCCEFPKTDLHLSCLTSLASHPTYPHTQQRERSPGKYDNSGGNQGWGLAWSATCLHRAYTFQSPFPSFLHACSFPTLFDPILYLHSALPLNISEVLHIHSIPRYPITNFTPCYQPPQTSNNSLGLYPNKACFSS